MYYVTKTWGHERGLSCAFRQHSAASHCHFIHGYALAVTVKFAAQHLDSRNWVVDFGALDDVKQWLGDNFDHKLLIAADDPVRGEGLFSGMHAHKVADVIIVPAVGCEAFARQIYDYIADVWLPTYDDTGRVRVLEVTVAEHGSNSATYSLGGPQDPTPKPWPPTPPKVVGA